MVVICFKPLGATCRKLIVRLQNYLPSVKDSYSYRKNRALQFVNPITSRIHTQSWSVNQSTLEPKNMTNYDGLYQLKLLKNMPYNVMGVREQF